VARRREALRLSLIGDAVDMSPSSSEMPLNVNPREIVVPAGHGPRLTEQVGDCEVKDPHTKLSLVRKASGASGVHRSGRR
jgi:hypothetical protein